MAKKKKNDIGCPSIAKFKLTDLRPAKYNPRVITEENLAGLAASIKKFGCVEPIVVNIRGGKNIIIGGHQRFKVLKTAGAVECICVTVDYSKTNEKLLNLTLNNPQVQGQFIERIDEYIEQLQAELGDDAAAVDLQIEKLQADIGPLKKDDCSYAVEEIRPFKKTHVLISFSPELLPQIQDHLEAILKIEGIEYEQCSN